MGRERQRSENARAALSGPHARGCRASVVHRASIGCGRALQVSRLIIREVRRS